MTPFVMAGLDPAIHVLLRRTQEDVDARLKAGHDELHCEACYRSRFVRHVRVRMRIMKLSKPSSATCIH
jgi:hypothetical protein